MPDIAAILDEIERQQAAVASSDIFVDRLGEWRELERLYILHGPLLLRLARAGDRLRKASEDTIHRCDEDGDCELCNAEAAFDAAASGAGEKEPR